MEYIVFLDDPWGFTSRLGQTRIEIEQEEE